MRPVVPFHSPSSCSCVAIRFFNKWYSHFSKPFSFLADTHVALDQMRNASFSVSFFYRVLLLNLLLTPLALFILRKRAIVKNHWVFLRSLNPQGLFLRLRLLGLEKILAMASSMKSFVDVAPGSQFPIQNLPFGVFRPSSGATPRPGVAIGDSVVDLSVLSDAGLFSGPLLSNSTCFSQVSFYPSHRLFSSQYDSWSFRSMLCCN